jgi:hypothetical protein
MEMTTRERELLEEKILAAVPLLSDFDKGFLLGKAEAKAEQKEKEEKELQEAG